MVDFLLVYGECSVDLGNLHAGLIVLFLRTPLKSGQWYMRFHYENSLTAIWIEKEVTEQQ